MRSIARDVGVSATVVSKLFRGDPDLCISEARRREIFAARDRLGGREAMANADICRRAAEAFDGWRAKNPNVTARVCPNALRPGGD